jgi:hypothetical protein
MRAPGITLVATALLALGGCSLAGLADGAGGDPGGTGGGASLASTSGISGTSSSSDGSSTSSTSSSASASSSSGDGGAGAGGAATGGAPPTSDLFAWAATLPGDYEDSTAGTDGRLQIRAIDATTVAVVAVISQAPVDGASREHILIQGRDAATGAQLFATEVVRQGGGATDRATIGRLAVRQGLIAIPMTFRGQLDLGDGAPLVADGSDAAVLLVDGADPDAPPRALHLGGTGDQIAQSSAYAGNGDLLLGGRFSDRLACPGGGAGLGADRGFVARIATASATCLASIHFGSVGARSLDGGVLGIAVGSADALVVGGFGGTLVVGNRTLVSQGGSDAFLMRLGVGNGNLFIRNDTQRRLGGDDSDLLRVALHLGEGAFAVAGNTDGSDIAFCAGDPLPRGIHAAVLRIENDGSCAWLRTWATDGPSRWYSARGLALGDDGGLVVSGMFRSISPCPGEAWGGIDADGFVFRLDPATGATTHGVRLGINAEQTATTVTAPAGSLTPIVGGSYEEPFDPLLPPFPVSNDVYLGGVLPLPALACAR